MKMRWQDRKRPVNHMAHLLTALGMAVCFIVTAPALSRVAQAEPESFSLTVSPGNQEFSDGTLVADDLRENADVVIDLYQVAAAEKDKSYDTYTYEPCIGYEDLKDYLGVSVFDKDGAINPAQVDWDSVAQMAAKIAVGGTAPAAACAEQGTLGSKTDLPKAGLYLAVIRDKNLEFPEYTETIDTKDSEGNDVSELVTIAYSEDYKYTFSPLLIAVPNKVDADGVTTGSTAEGVWQDAVDIVLKMEFGDRYGSLRITKTLENYETSEPVTFVFSVEAVKTSHGVTKTVYSDVVSLTFDSAGTKTYELTQKIPVGAQVIVTEEYSGAVYSVISDAEQSAVIAADEAAEVTFVNDYNDTGKGGGAITNHFENTENGGWTWEPVRSGGGAVDEDEAAGTGNAE